MKKTIYVFDFDNKYICNTENVIVDITNESLGINITKDFWYKST